jgi:hypothetical protein
MANKPNNPSLWSRAKSMAKQKFDVYPSAYANGWAAKWYKSKGGTWRKAAYGMEVMGDGGTPDNPGFNALPPSVQQKIINNMAKGGEKMPEEIARARFSAAGNLDKMSDYGYAYGGYIPEMMYGGKQYMQQGGEQEQVMQIIQMFAQMNQMDPNELMEKLQELQPEEQQQAIMEMAQVLEQTTSQQQPDMTQAAMAYGGYTTGIFAEGGEPNGEMLLGQMSAVSDKMNKLRQFVSPEQNLDPWIAYKLAIMDDSATSISDYMMYNPEAQEGMMEEDYDEEEMMMMQEMANGGYTVTRSNDRKGKTHKVTGPDGTVKYFGDSKLGQHPKDPKRKAAFYARHKKNLDGNPYFRAFARETWKEGGSTFSGNAWYQRGGEKAAQDNTYTNNAAKAKADYEGYMAAQKNASVANSLLSNPYSVLAFPDTESAFSGDSIRMFPGQTAFGKTPYMRDLGNLAGVFPQLSNAEMAKLVNSGKTRSYTDSSYMSANPEWLSTRPKKQYGGGFMPETMPFPSDYAVEMMKQGGIYIDPKKKGTFKAQATRMGMGVQEAASAILNAPKGKYTPEMRKKANFAKNFAKQMGGPVEGEVLDVTPEQLELLRQQGYEFEMM